MSMEVVQNKPHYVCSICKLSEEVEDGAVIYENQRSRKLHVLSTDVIAKTPTLRRTKNYICPNETCASQKNSRDKEAVFYRPSPHSFELEYLCTLCHTTFTP